MEAKIDSSISFPGLSFFLLYEPVSLSAFSISAFEEINFVGNSILLLGLDDSVGGGGDESSTLCFFFPLIIFQ